MALRAKIRGQMRAVSPAMARRLRAKGVEVEEVSALPMPEQPTPNMVPFAAAPPERVDPPSVPSPPAVAEDADEPNPEPRALGTFPVTVRLGSRRCSICGETGHTKAKCPLAELDAATRPDAEG